MNKIALLSWILFCFSSLAMEPARKLARTESASRSPESAIEAVPEMSDALRSAIMNNNLALVTTLIAQDGIHPGCLHTAANFGSVEICEFLLAQGALINDPDREKMTPLHWAALQGHAETCAFLMEQGALTDRADEDGKTALHWAAASRDLETCQVIMRSHNGAVNKADVKGRTPLHVVADEDTNFSTEDLDAICLLLIRHKAHVNSRTNAEETPLHLAVMGRLEEYDSLPKILIDNGADLQARDQRGRTPLHLAVYRKNPYADEDNEDSEDLDNDTGSITFCKELIARGADVNAADNKGRTPLHRAAKHHLLPLCELLHAAGAQLNPPDNNWDTPLHSASAVYKRDHPSNCLFYFLVGNGADVNAYNITKETPLHKATAEGRMFSDHHENSGALITLGAQVNAFDYAGRTPLYNAVHRRYLSPVAVRPLYENLIMRGAFFVPTSRIASDFNKQTLFNSLCLLRRFGLPTDVCYIVFFCIKELKASLLLLMFNHLRTSRLTHPLLSLPKQVRHYICGYVYWHSCRKMNGWIGPVEEVKHPILARTLAGDITYYLRIAKQLGYSPEPSHVRKVQEWPLKGVNQV